MTRPTVTTIGLAGVAVVVAILLGYCGHRVGEAATWRERARIADSTAKVEQKARARAEAQAKAALIASDNVGRAIDSLRTVARHAAQEARGAIETRLRYEATRQQAIAALARSQAATDSLSALVLYATTAETLLRADSMAMAASARQTEALRTALDQAEGNRLTLTVALDSARASLARMGAVTQQLQASVRAAHPASTPRVARMAISLGLGYCVDRDLTGRPCAGVVIGPGVRLW